MPSRNSTSFLMFNPNPERVVSIDYQIFFQPVGLVGCHILNVAANAQARDQEPPGYVLNSYETWLDPLIL